MWLKNKALVIFIVILMSGLLYHAVLESNTYKTGGRFHFGLTYWYLVFVGSLGYAAFIDVRHKWVRILWALSYAIVFVILLLSKIFEEIVNPLASWYTTFIYRLNILFTSPLPYVTLYFLVKMYDKPAKKTEDIE